MKNLVSTYLGQMNIFILETSKNVPPFYLSLVKKILGSMTGTRSGKKKNENDMATILKKLLLPFTAKHKKGRH